MLLRVTMLLAAATCLTASACDNGSSSPGGSSHLITFHSFAGLALRETRDQIEAAIGEKADRSQTMSDMKDPHWAQVEYPKHGLSLVYEKDHAEVIGTSAAYPYPPSARRYHTTDGVHVGSPEADVKEIPGVVCKELGHGSSFRFICRVKSKTTMLVFDGEGPGRGVTSIDLG